MDARESPIGTELLGSPQKRWVSVVRVRMGSSQSGHVPQIRGLSGCGLSLINKKWGSESMTPSQMQFRRYEKKSILRVEGLFFIRRLGHTESVGLRPSPHTPSSPGGNCTFVLEQGQGL